MTFVLSARGRDSIWLVADTRLSDGRDDGMKVLLVEATDGLAIVGYAGLGATGRRMQPSTWMSNVLRGRPGLTIEESLGVIAGAANRELPRYLKRLTVPAHFVIAPAFIRGVGPRLFSLKTVVDEKREVQSEFVHVTMGVPGNPAVRYAVAGTGGDWLFNQADWHKSLLRLIKANDQGRVPDLVVADLLAALNHRAVDGVGDDSVGPKCVVVWRRRPEVGSKRGGGAHQFYDGTERDRWPDYTGTLPTISEGTDMKARLDPMMEQMARRMNDPRIAFEEILDVDLGEIGRGWERLPHIPDERLR